jgi:DNA-binding NarL/FixJ family response regulator
MRNNSFRHSVGDPFTPRETEVATLLGQGASRKKIARELGIAPRTAEAHTQHMMEKTGARSARELTVFLVRSERIATLCGWITKI